MAAKRLSSEKKKKMALAVLGLVLLCVVAYQAFLSGPAPRPKLRTQGNASDAATPRTTAPIQNPRQAESAAGKQAQIDQLLADTTPLELASLAAPDGGVEVKRNIFAYYVKPPEPPPPPPRPPPIALRLIQPQTAIAGTPRGFAMTLTGQNFPQDAQVLFGGVLKPTKRLSDTQLTTEITAADYSSPRSVNVEVKSQSRPAELFSNPLEFIAQQSPEPPFKFIGLIGDLAVLEVTTGAGVKEYMRLRRGETIEGVWRIDSISETGIEVTDTRYDISKHVPL